MTKVKPFCRILIVEDNIARAKLIKTWLPKDIVPVVSTSAGKAIGLIKRDKGHVYAGIMLDHDLQEQIASQADIGLNGMDVVNTIIRYIPNDVPILVHSTNESQGPAMARKLESLKYMVMQISMNQLTLNKFKEWIDDVRDLWEDLLEESEFG